MMMRLMSAPFPDVSYVSIIYDYALITVYRYRQEAYRQEIKRVPAYNEKICGIKELKEVFPWQK